MRAAVVVGLLALLLPAAVSAQTPVAPAPATPASAAPAPAPAAPAATTAPRRRAAADITRDDYIQRAVDRAKRAAERRFDAMDADHNGILTGDERRAYRQSHSRSRAPAEDEPAEPTAAKPPQ